VTRTGDLLDLDGARYVVTDTGPAYVYERDAKGKERQVVGGRFVHLEKIAPSRAPEGKAP